MCELTSSSKMKLFVLSVVWMLIKDKLFVLSVVWMFIEDKLSLSLVSFTPPLCSTSVSCSCCMARICLVNPLAGNSPLT